MAFAQTGEQQGQKQDQGQLPLPPPAQTDGAWHRFGDSTRSDSSRPYSTSNPAQDPAAGQNGAPNYGPPQQQQQQQRQQQQRQQQPYTAAPQNLTIPSGTWITVRTTNPISTDHNQAGDAFGAVLSQPIVINGIVVARRGQSVEGRIANAEKAGHVKGTSRLSLELIQVGLVDGQQVNLHTQMTSRNGNTSYGRDAAAIGLTTGTGAAIGAAVNGGVGAGVGAGIGLVTSIAGVLLTRGEPAVVRPETVLTFQTVDAVTISTANAPEAFSPVGQQDYEGNQQRLVNSTPPPSPRYGYGAPYPYPYVTPYPYYGYGYGYGYGASFYFGHRGGYRRW